MPKAGPIGEGSKGSSIDHVLACLSATYSSVQPKLRSTGERGRAGTIYQSPFDQGSLEAQHRATGQPSVQRNGSERNVAFHRAGTRK